MILDITDTTIYRGIKNGMNVHLKTIMHDANPKMRIQRASFPFQAVLTNFSAINLTGDTKISEEKMQMLNSVNSCSSNGRKPNDVSIIAFAGVGSPLKLSDWLESTLNIASLIAEKTEIKIAIQKYSDLASKSCNI